MNAGAARVVYVVDEAERLKNVQGMRSDAQPEGVESHRPHAGRSLDGLDTLLIRDALFFRSPGELSGPGLPVIRPELEEFSPRLKLSTGFLR
jgi:hypothetical protein